MSRRSRQGLKSCTTQCKPTSQPSEVEETTDPLWETLFAVCRCQVESRKAKKRDEVTQPVSVLNNLIRGLIVSSICLSGAIAREAPPTTLAQAPPQQVAESDQPPLRWCWTYFCQ